MKALLFILKTRFININGRISKDYFLIFRKYSLEILKYISIYI